MKIKICGITNMEDARMAVEEGADLVGAIIDVPVETPRKIGLSIADGIRRIVQDADREFVAVLMPSNIEDVRRVHESLHPDYIQLHGRETPGLVKEASQLGPGIIKALHAGEHVDMDYAKTVSQHADMILTDTKAKGMAGGTGMTHDFGIDLKIRDAVGKPLILAGGLNPENVMQAVEKVRPDGVDVSSGVERTPGRKDRDKVRRFIGQLR